MISTNLIVLLNMFKIQFKFSLICPQLFRLIIYDRFGHFSILTIDAIAGLCASYSIPIAWTIFFDTSIL